MRKLLTFLVVGVVAAMLCIGCDPSAGYADETVKNPETEKKQVKAGGAVQQGGVADLGADPAPAGVQTGLPGGGKK